MRAIWKFKAIRDNLTGFYIRRTCGTDELTLTDEEAMDFSGRVQEFYENKGILRVEGRTVSPIDWSVPDSSKPRELFILRPHPSGKGYLADETRFGHAVWHLSLDEAISYSAFRGRGYLTEVQIYNEHRTIEGVVLIHQLHNGLRDLIHGGRRTEAMLQV